LVLKMKMFEKKDFDAASAERSFAGKYVLKLGR
jgi:hypothetical protein